MKSFRFVYPSRRSSSPPRALALTLLGIFGGGSPAYSTATTAITINNDNDNQNTALTGTKPQRPVDALTWQDKFYPALSPAAAQDKLRQEEQSYQFPVVRRADVSRVDSTRLASNNPVEDERAYEIVGVGQPAEDWHFWGVYDGHAGWATSSVLRHSLIAYVVRGLESLPALPSRTGGKKDRPPKPDPALITPKIQESFLTLDTEITQTALHAMSDPSLAPATALSRIAAARAGSCALLACYKPSTSVLRVACVGDSRAVLGHRASSTSAAASKRSVPSHHTAYALTVDQTGFHASETARITAAHPDEPGVVDPCTGRLRGLAVTRAFGDNRWTWSAAQLEQWRTRFFGTPIRPGYRSPPYLTAEPVVTSRRIRRGDFVILASDGFWNRVSSEDAVECVQLWLQRNDKKSNDNNNNNNNNNNHNEVEEEGTARRNSEREQKDGNTEQDAGDHGISSFYHFRPADYTCQDENAATHLLRNALGGCQSEVVRGLLSMRAPESRAVRDDITIQVIFFGDVASAQEKQV